MSTYRELTSDIKGIANHLGAIKRREDIDDREIELYLNQYRELWIQTKNRTDKALYFDAKPSLVQDLGCRILACVDKSECDALKVGSYVSKIIVPKPVEINGSLWVGSINKRHRFIETTADEIEGKLAAPYSSKFLFYWRTTATSVYLATMDNDIYNDLCYVNVRAILSDPRQAEYKKSLTVASCGYNTSVDLFPATGDMEVEIKLQILSKEFNIAMQYLRDYSNNNRDDRAPAAAPARR